MAPVITGRKEKNSNQIPQTQIPCLFFTHQSNLTYTPEKFELLLRRLMCGYLKLSVIPRSFTAFYPDLSAWSLKLVRSSLYAQHSKSQNSGIAPRHHSPSAVQPLESPLSSLLLLHQNPCGSNDARVSTNGDDSPFRLRLGNLCSPQDGLEGKANNHLRGRRQEGHEIEARRGEERV